MNSFGAIAFDAIESEKRILRATQLFRTGEVWGFDSYLPRPTNRPTDSAPPGMWAREMETAYMRCLPMYFDFLRTHLKCEAPFEIEAGLSSARKLSLYVSNGRETWVWGPFLTDEVTIRVRLATATTEDIDTALLRIFEGFFDAVGRRRPEGFNNFPKQA